MKKYILLFVVAVMSLTATTSCDEEQPSNSVETSYETLEGLNDTVKAHLIAQDSLMNELVSKVDTLVEVQNSLKEKNDELEQRLEQLEKPSRWLGILTIAALVLSLAAVALIVFVMRHCVDEKGVEDIVRRKLQKKSQQNNSDVGLDNNTVQRIKNDIKSHDAKINDLCKRIGTLMNKVDDCNRSLPQMPDKPSRQYAKKGYVGSNSDEYFAEIQNVRQDTSVFEIDFQSGDKGTFNIISIDKIKQLNGVEKVVYCETRRSGCTLAEARNYKLLSPGVCEKVPGGWKVTQKLKIEIY